MGTRGCCHSNGNLEFHFLNFITVVGGSAIVAVSPLILRMEDQLV